MTSTIARSMVEATATPRGAWRRRRSTAITGLKQLVKNTASTNGTNTGRKRYSETPMAMSVSVRRQNVCTPKSRRRSSRSSDMASSFGVVFERFRNPAHFE